MGDGFRAMTAGCGGLLHRDPSGPTPCPGEVIAVGLRLYTFRRSTVWLAFGCEQHLDQLIAPRRLLPRDHETLLLRRDRQRLHRAGRTWFGDEEQPLARGRDAERLVARAQAWAARHPVTPPHHDT